MRTLPIAIALVLAACAAATPSANGTPGPTLGTAAASPTPIATTALPNGGRIEDLAAQFRYDKSASLVIRELAPPTRAGSVAISEIEYGNGRGGVAQATLFVPDGPARRPAIVMSPGSNQPRSQLSSEGLGLANALGAVVLVVDQSQLAMHRERVWTFTAQDREEAIESVVDLLRGIDLLSVRPDVDTTRIALHGFSYGASLVAMAAAFEPRVRTVVLRSGGPQILRELAGARASDAAFAAYIELMSTVDQLKFAAAIPGASAVLVQNGAADATYPADGVRAWQAAIAGTKVVRAYDGAGHGLDAAADSDRAAFLRERLRA